MDEQNVNPDRSNAMSRDKIETTKISSSNRIANTEFLESVDQGMSLSMHQPWASLLVAGIKM